MEHGWALTSEISTFGCFGSGMVTKQWDWMGQWGALPAKILITNIYKCQTLLGWQSAESHKCKVFKCTSGADRQSLQTSCGKCSHSQ
jgi:hypothetical protein